MSIGKYFADCHPTLSDLKPSVLDEISQIILSYRDGVSSVCVIFRSLNALSQIIADIPVEIQEASTLRYFVDLSSVGTDKVRFYVDSPSKEESIIGFYFDKNNKMIEKKHYKKDIKDKNLLFIDRYNADGALISADEPEKQSDRTCWQGLTEWADLADASPYDVIYLHKVNKIQSYIFVQ